MNLDGYVVKPAQAKILQKESWWAPLFQYLPHRDHRRFHAYCIGLPRSGTHSIGYMFATHYVAKHEPMDDQTIHHLLRHLAGDYDERTLRALIRCRDRDLGLEMEASHYLYSIVETLVDLYQNSKVILTIRDPIPWLASEINQNLRTRSATPKWRALERTRYGCYGFDYQPEERALQSLDDIWPVASYLSYWRDHSERVIKHVPEHRLLVLRTHEIKEKIDQIANFLDISPDTIDVSASQSGARKSNEFDLYAHVNVDFVREQVNTYCGDLVQQFFA